LVAKNDKRKKEKDFAQIKTLPGEIWHLRMKATVNCRWRGYMCVAYHEVECRRSIVKPVPCMLLKQTLQNEIEQTIPTTLYVVTNDWRT